MDISIIIAENKHLIDCKIALQKSEIGSVYFTEEDKVIRVLNEGISRGEIFVAIDEDDKCLGFIWFTLNGAFQRCPYLHIIAIKEEYRNCGVGKKLLQYFEEISSKTSSNLFLVVGEFNQRAKKLYQRLGYNDIGVIPNLYKKGINEHLMMKEI